MKRILQYLFTLYCAIRYRYRFQTRITIGTKVNLSTRIEGNNRIGNSVISGAYIGYATYIGDNCNLACVNIGKYSSIGSNVNIIAATHPTKSFVTTHPAFFSTKGQAGFTYVDKDKFEEIKYYNKHLGILAKIGNDVWIGNDVTILGGVEIGDGAIIATGAVITKSVSPYSIVGGVPAKHIRYRFSENQIERLLQIRWWNFSPSILKKYSYLFEDISKFLENNISTIAELS